MKDLYLFVAISSANHFVFAGTRLAVVLYAVSLGASPAVVGVLAALFGLLAAFFSVATGRLMDRVGPATPMLWFSALMAAGALLGFVWRDLAALFFVCTTVGTFYSLFFVGHTQWIGRIGKPEDRVGNFALASLGLSGGNLFGPLLAGFAIDHFGHPAAFLVLALVPLFPVAVIALRVIEPPPGRAPGSHPASAGPRKGVLQLVREGGLLRIYGVSVLANTTWSIVGLLIPIYGVQLGLSASTIGLLMGSYAVASVAIRALMTRLARRFTSWQLMIMSLGSSGLCFVALPFFSGVPALMVVTFLIGLGMGLAGPLSQALLYEAAPPERVGEVMGFRVTTMNLTQTVIPLASGAASAAIGVAPVFWALALTLLAGSYGVRAQWARSRHHDASR